MTQRYWLALRVLGDDRYEDVGVTLLPTDAAHAVDDYLSQIDSVAPTGQRFLLVPIAGEGATHEHARSTFALAADE